MHEHIFSSKSYRIYAYFKSSNVSNVTVKECVEIRSNVSIPVLKGFKTAGNLYFPEKVLVNSNNLLYLLVIKFCDHKNLFKVLKKIIPTVFDLQLVKKINFEFFLYTNRSQIIQIAQRILNNHSIVQETQHKLYKLTENINCAKQKTKMVIECTGNDNIEDLIQSSDNILCNRSYELEDFDDLINLGDDVV